MVFLRTAPSLLSLLSGGRGGALPLLLGLLCGQVCHIPRCFLLFRSQLLQAADLERELGEARAELVALRLPRISEREEFTACVESMRRTLHHSNAVAANLLRDLEVQRGNASVLQEMNNFICEQLKISEGAKDHLEQALADAQGQLEAEQVESVSLKVLIPINWLINPRIFM